MALVTFLLKSVAGWKEGWVKLQVASGWCFCSGERAARRAWSLFQGWALKSMGRGSKWYTCFTDVPLQSVQLFGAVRSQMLVLHWGDAAAKAEPRWSEMPVTDPQASSPSLWQVSWLLGHYIQSAFSQWPGTFLVFEEHSLALIIQNVSALACVLC